MSTATPPAMHFKLAKRFPDSGDQSAYERMARNRVNEPEKFRCRHAMA